MRSLLLGLDVSPKRLGYGLVDLLTGEPVACGCESIDLPDHGWMHQQVRDAFLHAGAGIVGEIQAVYIEDTAQAGKYRQHDAGRAQGIVQAEVERRWPWATVQFVKPKEWRVLAGLPGNASKKDVWIVADDMLEEVGLQPASTQDAADALLIAVAGQRRNNETWSAGAERGEAA